MQAGLVVLAVLAAGQAFNPFESSTERLLRQAHEARRAGELALAWSLLAEAEAAAGGVAGAGIMYERGLVLRDRGDRDAAVDLLKRSADLDPRSDARVDLAALLADLGRWPESVVVLRTAFLERGGTLRADAVMTDARFARLVGFAPYQALIAQVREEQAGWLGKLQLRLESIDASIQGFQSALDKLTAVVARLTGLLTSRGAGIVALVLLAFLIGGGLVQMRLLGPPWSVLAGTAGAAAVWRGAARLLSDGRDDGWSTILPAAAIVVVPVAIAALVRWRRARSAARLSAAPAERKSAAS